MVASRGSKIEKIIADIDDEYGTYEYRRLDMRVPDDKKQRLMRRLKAEPLKKVLDAEVAGVKDYDGFKYLLKDRSWFMLRLSGTEPIVRVYAEAPTQTRALKILEFGKKLVESA
jgi:phosphomannomutase